jgi:hypothetical protein
MNTLTALGIFLIGIGLILIIPYILIWAINGLFGSMIAYTWTNWFYSLVIILLFRINK